MIKINNVFIIAKMTLLEAIRGKIIRILAIMSVLLLSVNYIITEMYSWSLGKVSIELGLSASSVIGLLIVFFLCLRILYNDLERHSIYFILSRPIRIGEYVLGKYVGLAALLCISVVILGIGSAISIQNVIWSYPAYVSPLFSWAIFGWALVFQALSLLVILAICFFWYSFICESFVALVLSITSYQICQSMELIRQLFIESYKGGKIDQFSYYMALVVTYIFPNLSFMNFKSQAAYGLPISSSILPLTFIYGLSYIAVLLFIASFLLSKRKTF